MKNISLLILFLTISLLSFSQPVYQYSWKYYTPGTTGILGESYQQNSGVPTGIYIARLRTENHSKAIKILVN